MNMVILNGMSSPDRKDLEGQLEAFTGAFRALGHQTESYTLREKNIKDCIGCFQCWVKTPGFCVHKDDMPDILRALVRADEVVYVSDFHLHHLSPPLKAVLDRAIPLRRAYLMVGKNGHMGHYPRYPLHHRGILLVEAHPDLDDGDLKAMAAS